MKNLSLLLTLCAVLMIARVACADEAADKAQVRELETKTSVALLKADLATLAEIFSEDWVLVESQGEIIKGAEIFKELQSGNLKFTSYELGEMEVRVFGDTAVVVGHGNPHGEWKGEKFEQNEVFSDTFIRVGGKWRCILSHSSAIPDAK